MIKIRNHIKIIFLFSFILFIINKVYIRKIVTQGNAPESLEVLSYSIPNFLEAVMGTSLSVAILLIFKSRIRYFNNIKNKTLILIAIAFSSLFVLTQELKYHNIGGNNVYDINDLIASIIGILFISYIILKFGIINTTET